MTVRAIALLLSSLLAGCAMVGPDYQRPALDLPAQYPDLPAQAGTLSLPTDWWKLYQDATLDRLVASGLEKNTDIRLAAARIEEAAGLLREADATFFPLVLGNAAVTRSEASTQTSTHQPTAPKITNHLAVSLSTSFELDFWGRLRRGVEASRAEYLGSRYGHDVVALTLAANIAQSYFLVRSLDAQILVTDQTLRGSIELLDLTKRRAQAGRASDLDISQADAIRAQAAAQSKELKRQRAAAIHQLGLLSGVLDLRLEPGDLRALPTPPLPPEGLPSTLLERRPDVRAAEARLVSANALIGVARAAQFPSFSLTAALGVQSAELNNLFSSGAGIWSVGLGVVAPIIDAGRYAARTEQAEARERQAAAQYEKTVQVAFREVADALTNVSLAGQADQDLGERVELARNALRLATLRYQSGYSAYLEVLDAQRTLNEAQLAHLRNRQATLAYTVDLMNALGGGWTAY